MATCGTYVGREREARPQLDVWTGLVTSRVTSRAVGLTRWHDVCVMKKGKHSKLRHWTGEKDSKGRHVYIEHQGRTQINPTREAHRQALALEKYRTWQVSKCPLMDANGALYRPDTREPLAGPCT